MATTHPILRSSVLRRHILMAAPLVVAAAILFVWLILPHVEYLDVLRCLEKAVGRMTDEVAMVRDTLDEKVARLRAMQSELVELRDGLFTWEESGLLAHDLHVLAGEAGCTVVAVDLTEDEERSVVGGTETPAAVRTFHADVVATGRHDQVVAFFRRIQEGRRRVRVDSCGLEIMDRDGGRVEFRCGLTLHTAVPSGPPENATLATENSHRERFATASGPGP